MSHPGFSHKVADPPSVQTPQWLPLRKLSNSPLNRNLWLLELKYDEDNAFLSDGICNGFKLVEPGTRFSDVDMDNYKSATNPVNRPMVEQTIRQEIALGNYVVSPTKPRIVSALGAIPKPNSPEICLIHDCSRPHGQAVNDYITTNSFKFQTLDDATTLLQPNYYMAKIDLRHAYHSVPIHPDNYKATGCKSQFLGDHSYTYFSILAYRWEPKAHPKSFIA